MDIDKNEAFDIALKYVTETSENIFLTGKAGTGKTTFLKYLKEHCPKNIIITAPTGVAAMNAGGVTLHSLFQLPLEIYLPNSFGKQTLMKNQRFSAKRKELLRTMDLLVIDEVSMVRCDVLDAIDYTLKSVRQNHNAAFGGAQVLFIGDLHQLPPVAKTNEWSILKEYYNSPFFFDSKVIAEQKPLLIELTEVYRQKEGLFLDLLNKVRTNSLSEDDFIALNNRFIPGFIPLQEENFITLTTHNKQADAINTKELNKIIKAPFKYVAEIKGNFTDNIFPADEVLTLKVGAQVMFLKNDSAKQFYNSKIGVVSFLDDDEIRVTCDGNEINVHRETWENTKYSLSRETGKLTQEVTGSFKQFPLRLAWAITIHKSQGLTFDKVMIDAALSFSSGQVYVALSRCTSIGGIVLLARIPASAIMSNELVVSVHSGMVCKGSLEDRYKSARIVYTQNILEELFYFKRLCSLSADLLNTFSMCRNQILESDYDAQLLQNINNGIIEAGKIGSRFCNQMAVHFKEGLQIEENLIIKERLSAAGAHFHASFKKVSETISELKLESDYSETSIKINSSVLELVKELKYILYLLNICDDDFSVTKFLKAKIDYTPEKKDFKRPAKYDIDHSLLSSLKSWRNEVCAKRSVPVFMVASTETLKDIALYLPCTKEELLLISGFGITKFDKYGEEILDIVNDYCHRYNLQSKMANYKSRKIKVKKKQAESTQSISYKMYSEGNSVLQIAEKRNLAEQTIFNHLIPYVEQSKISHYDFVTKEREKLILFAIDKIGADSLKNIKSFLPEDFTYIEIKMVLIGNNIKSGSPVSS